jgi:Uma2 family endonuclease
MALADIRTEDMLSEDREDVEVHRWTIQEYERMAETGVFRDRRVELVNGIVYNMTPQNSPHAAVLAKAAQALAAVFGATGHHVRSQSPLELGQRSMPEPDLAVVSGAPDDYLDRHPPEAALVVEITDSSQVHDRKRKGGLYAEAGLQEYWIINLRHDVVEVCRDPAQGLYRTRRLYHRGEAIAPAARPEASIAVDDLLPRHAPAS